MRTAKSKGHAECQTPSSKSVAFGRREVDGQAGANVDASISNFSREAQNGLGLEVYGGCQGQRAERDNQMASGHRSSRTRAAAGERERERASQPASGEVGAAAASIGSSSSRVE
ncbi:hypothetical protein AXG93_4368s1190 [Marchantia polymorpha subsp. ruderalis]|uniref:Uncharacterized protein n=1 Tax=Marchantia polymorpha subsp. ruderalis TaxID=1480154 RepID=A0A176VXX7_MARPO|nr:hypothetical protein AXG93_4368s1190 [Marchantia polymorpha subsp. ruderalis]